jgi:hypothetical protein
MKIGALKTKGFFVQKIRSKFGAVRGRRRPAIKPDRTAVGRAGADRNLAGPIGFRASEMAAGM